MKKQDKGNEKVRKTKESEENTRGKEEKSMRCEKYGKIPRNMRNREERDRKKMWTERKQVGEGCNKQEKT